MTDFDHFFKLKKLLLSKLVFKIFNTEETCSDMCYWRWMYSADLTGRIIFKENDLALWLKTYSRYFQIMNLQIDCKVRAPRCF